MKSVYLVLILVTGLTAAYPFRRGQYSRRNSKSSLVIHVPMRMPSYDEMKKGFVFPSAQPMPMVVQWVNNKPVTLSTTEQSTTTLGLENDAPAIFDMNMMKKPDSVPNLEVDAGSLPTADSAGSVTELQTTDINEPVNNHAGNVNELTNINEVMNFDEEVKIQAKPELIQSTEGSEVPQAVTTNLFSDTNVFIANEPNTNGEDQEISTIDSEFMPVHAISDSTAGSDTTILPSADEVEGSGALPTTDTPQNVVKRVKRDLEPADQVLEVNNEIEKQVGKETVKEATDSDISARQYGNHRQRRPSLHAQQHYHGYQPMMRRVGEACYGVYCQMKSFVKWLLA